MATAAQTSLSPVSAAAFPAAENVPHLTGLRALAAFMVLSLHPDQIHGNPLARSVPVIGQGNLGVDIFFVLSGYILSHVYALPTMPMNHCRICCSSGDASPASTPSISLCSSP